MKLNLTTVEAGEIANVNRNTIGQWVMNGWVVGDKVNGRWLVSEESLRKFMAIRAQKTTTRNWSGQGEGYTTLPDRVSSASVEQPKTDICPAFTRNIQFARMVGELCGNAEMERFGR